MKRKKKTEKGHCIKKMNNLKDIKGSNKKIAPKASMKIEI